MLARKIILNGTVIKREWLSSVNFINILHMAFASIFLRQKLQSQNVTREKLCKALSCKNKTVLDLFQDSSKTGSGINFPIFLPPFCSLFCCLFWRLFCCLFAAFFASFLLTGEVG
jgi:hypothetical protein